jgi:hypothetical protein
VIEAPIINAARFRRSTGEWYIVNTDRGAGTIVTPFPLLLDHKREKRIGRGMSYRRSDRGVYYATFEFDDREMVERIRRGWRPNISPLFKIISSELATVGGVVTNFYRKWELLEISIVPRPANPTVGFGRDGIVRAGESVTIAPDLSHNDIRRLYEYAQTLPRDQRERLLRTKFYR